MNTRLAIGRLLYYGPMIGAGLFALAIAYHSAGLKGIIAGLIGVSVLALYFGLTTFGIKIMVDESSKNNKQ